MDKNGNMSAEQRRLLYPTYNSEEDFEAERVRLRREYENDPWYDERAKLGPQQLESCCAFNTAWAKMEAYNKYCERVGALEYMYKRWKKRQCE